MEVKIGGTTLSLVIGDITQADTEAIVNAANPSLMGGGGVDGAIHSKGGPSILQECKKIRETLYPDGLPTGEAVITSGGNLKAKYVIHTVGPICDGFMTEKEKQLLSNAYRNSLTLAKIHNIKSISFPSISTGAYRCDKKEASKVALQTVIDFIKENPNWFKEIRFVLFTEDIYHVYKQSLEEILNVSD
ncbi:O-acetyl-ADP-ribose deacetylase [Sulfurihydrogenibium subterraneum]|uniref:O-acetyl-ADP-ribose deacetylase n=1 Tax=Sulfurihydrogenibium subterraneum TaxID=171121 RepID=UPI00048CF752|nr:O-acetyl-ADP-ribose deacetylase [Sulfurihydrogenibium subterraneum]